MEQQFSRTVSRGYTLHIAVMLDEFNANTAHISFSITDAEGATIPFQERSADVDRFYKAIVQSWEDARWIANDLSEKTGILYSDEMAFTHTDFQEMDQEGAMALLEAGIASVPTPFSGPLSEAIKSAPSQNIR